MTAFVCKTPDFRGKEKPNKRVKVDVPHGISYNGGTVVKGKWYSGFEVPEPIIPEGYELASDYCGSQLNAHPPYVTMYLQPKGFK